jgi:tRNA dimethylallyltransferase
MGPTASGKTALAFELADRHDFQLVNVDSAQIYRGMDIGTGKPDAQTLQRYPHELMDILDPAEAYSASDFRADALRIIEEAFQKGRVPLLVGGTMLYFKALRDGLAAMPSADSDTRRRIEEKAETEGWSAVHAWLGEVDPDSAARIHPNDPQRLQRALEVYLVSGSTMSEFHRAEQVHNAINDNTLPFNLRFLAIIPEDRGLLHERIAKRFRQMLADRLLDEVAQLHGRSDLSLDLPSMKSVGYRQVWQYLDGQMDYDQMVEKSIIATRQLAKRQLTWLRSWENLTSLTGTPAQSAANVLKYVDSTAI